MSDKTKIEWCDATVNAVNGCTVHSPGCTNCYAMRLAGTRLRHHPSRAGLTVPSKAGPVWTGEVRLNETQLLQPLSWKRPRRIFWNAHGDPFHKNVPDEWIDREFAVMALTPQHTHMVLTKRSTRMREYLTARWPYMGCDMNVSNRIASIARDIDPRRWKAIGRILPGWPLPNVWLGISVEDQARADERIPDLLATPAAVRFVSAEPLLGAVDLTKIQLRRDGQLPNVLSNQLGDYVRPLLGNFIDSPKIDWVIVGGESGPNARYMNPDWARSLRDQCAAAGTAFFMKQLARNAPIPDDLMIRQWPGDTFTAEMRNIDA